MRADRLPLVTLDGRHAGELLAHPCPCGQRPRCTLGLHILYATRDMTPGPRAQSFEPAMARGAPALVDGDRPPDPTLTIDQDFHQLLTAYHNTALDLTRAIDRLRPDRWTPLPDPATDNDWCRNHLETIGACEPRHRGDLCRSCYDTYRAYGHIPDAELMRQRETRGYYRQRDFVEWKARLPKSPKRKRKKAS